MQDDQAFDGNCPTRPELKGELRLSWDGYSQPDEERVEGIPLRVLQLYAQHHGYRFIGPAEVAVLDACAAMTDEGIDAATGQSLSVDRALEAELERRVSSKLDERKSGGT